MFQEQCTVIFCRQVVRDTFLIRLAAPSIAGTIEPGQMLFVRVAPCMDPLLRRPFAAYNADRTEKTVDIMFEVKGQGTQILSAKKSGDEVDVLGPAGTGFPLPVEPSLPVIALAGGMGFGPMHFLSQRWTEEKRQVTFFYGTQTAEKLVVKSFEKPLAGFISTDDGSFGERGFITAILEHEAHRFPAGSMLCACGPEPMLKAAAGLASRREWRCLLSLERHMACGVGVCNGCVVDTRTSTGELKRKRVCCDGPVFNGRDILWT